MERSKYLVLPFLVCTFTVMFFVSKTDYSKSFDLTIISGRLRSIYSNVKYQRNLSLLIPKPRPATTLGASIVMPKSFLTGTLKPTTSVPKSSTQSMKTKTTSKIISTTTQYIKNNTRNYYLCPSFLGGFGNQLFQYAAHFGAAMAKNMTVMISSKAEVSQIFYLKTRVSIQDDTGICRSALVRGDSLDCGFDANLFKFNNTRNIRLATYLQSWKYFYNYSDQLRRDFTFKEHIQKEANKILNGILAGLHISRNLTILIGVHIRRGDMVNHSFGYDVATPGYLKQAVQYFKNKYNNTVFIVSTQDMTWTQTHMPKNISVQYINSSKREVIVATLASCDHTITTVGSFGWWIGWLTGGEVTYYKWPAKEGSALRTKYSKDYSDFFYPGWQGF